MAQEDGKFTWKEVFTSYAFAENTLLLMKPEPVKKPTAPIAGKLSSYPVQIWSGSVHVAHRYLFLLTYPCSGNLLIAWNATQYIRCLK
jgi:hypothetical protein